MSQMLRYFLLMPVATIVGVIFQNCGQSGQISKVSESIESVAQTPIGIIDETEEHLVIKVLPSTQFICSPFGNDSGQSTASSGLKAELTYIDPNSSLPLETKRSYGVRDYFNGESQFIKAPATLFMSQIFAPTQNFDQGFQLSNNTYLTTTSGERLIEWFALHLQSVLKLTTQDEAGEYEFATISDDGSRLFLGAPLKEIVNNDGPHTVKMMCSTETVQLNQQTRLPLSYYYNQGPRTEIASVLLWRKKVDNMTVGTYKHCGVSDARKFWNPSDRTEGEFVQEILADGWKVVGANNFELPGSQINPCTSQNTNLISMAEFSPLENASTQLNLSFVNGANIKANLYNLRGTDKVLVQSYDIATQIRDRITLDLTNLKKNQTYSIEVLLENTASGTRVLNEVRFEIIADPTL